MDAPCRYVSTSLLTQISFEDRRATSYVVLRGAYVALDSAIRF